MAATTFTCEQWLLQQSQQKDQAESEARIRSQLRVGYHLQPCEVIVQTIRYHRIKPPTGTPKHVALVLSETEQAGARELDSMMLARATVE